MRYGKYGLSQQFTKGYKKFTKKRISALQDKIEKGLKRRLNSWESLVKTALSRDITSVPNEVGKKSHMATIDRARLFPYMREGNLRSGVRTSIRKTMSDVKLAYSVSASIRRKTAHYTNTAQSTKFPSAWQGWFDDVMTGHGRGIVTESVRDIFSDFVQQRRKKLF